jgi:ribosomal protein S18 acetylase RimI-like enzyme
VDIFIVKENIGKMIQKLEWDSVFFDLLVGELNADLVYSGDYYDLIIVKSTKNEQVYLLNYASSHSEQKITFKKQLFEKSGVNIDDVWDFDSNRIPNDEFYELAYESGKYSRYKLDPNFQDTKFKSLYNLWVDNTINKTFGDKIFYCMDSTGSKVVGFVSLKLNEEDTTIGLIAVDPLYQGRGIGQRLIQKVESFSIKSGRFSVLIPTQEENHQACSFYSKLGYVILSKFKITHYWKKK